MKKSKFAKIEKKWQQKWEKGKIFESNISKKPKFFLTIPYPYVNGGPHVGHSFTNFRGDVYARFKRMNGFNVLYPQGFHATGQPIVGAIERLDKKDPVQISTFKLFGASDSDIKNFIKHGPEFTAKYWMKKWIQTLKKGGFSIDWRRSFITTTMTPTYSRFVEWQYNTLKKKGFVVQGTHPVIWCPHDQSPTGDHDRLEGEGESTIEYTILKFRLDSGEVLPCGTLRPETVYGATNLWVNPEVEYVKANVGKETWIISKQAAGKLADQLKKVKIIGKVRGYELMGKQVTNPVTRNKIMVLPASYVDPEAATGIVVSVPAHAPYDWVGLRDLQQNPDQIKKYGLNLDLVLKIKPISLIKVPGFGEFPAVELVEKMRITDQKDKMRLEKATSELYKAEFHKGVLNNLYENYAGKRISEIKEVLIEEFKKMNAIDSIWESTGRVVCRCMTVCHVKILENQWFLKYSDPEWKRLTKECISQMKFYPEEVRSQFLNTVDWLKDKACTRKGGLGTPLPWDRQWIVETLSDSTIYMAYYTLAKLIDQKNIPSKKLTDEVFDYIFSGRGNPIMISKNSKLSKEVLKKLRREFDYFYPVDLRNSGKDLVQHHLTFFIFHHVALFDKKYWPKSIGVNGFVNVSGTKMSKSKGNITPMDELIEKVGADLVRINVVADAEGMNDANWRDESLSGYESRILFLMKLAKDLKKTRRTSIQMVDKFLLSRINEMIKSSAGNYELMKFRSASQFSFFDSVNELKWYLERVGGIKNANRKILTEAISIVIRLVAPLLPHLAEEINQIIGGKKLVSISYWPRMDEKKIDRKIMEMENVLKKTIDDITNVLKLAGKKEKLYLYFATDKELEYFNQSVDFIKKRFKFKKVSTFRNDDEKKYDPQNKSSKAKFGKPGIFLE